MRLVIELETLTDTCFAGGRSAGTGDVDTATVTDAEGMPILRGRTLKGLLVEEAAAILDHLGSEEAAAALFGEPGQHESSAVLSFGDGSVPSAIRDAFRNSWDPQVLSTVRRQTRIDADTGAAATGSFRSTRLLRVGVRLRCAVIAARDLTKAERALLAACVASVRRVGLHRNEGWGRVRCRLFDLQGAELTPKWVSELGEADHERPARGVVSRASEPSSSLVGRSVVELDLVLEQPLLIADRASGDWVISSLPFLPGSVFLGAAAARWLRSKPCEDPSLDAEFRRLFLDGAVRWLNGYPDDGSARALPTPSSWREDESRRELLDLAHPEVEDLDPEELAQHKASLKDSFFVAGDEQVRVLRSATVAGFHHQRDREKGRADDGEIFLYEALASGQRFRAVVLCEEPGAAAIVRELLKDATLQLARSRTATYGGAARVTDIRIFPANGWRELPCRQQPDALLLTSDYLGRSPTGVADPAALMSELEQRLGLTSGALANARAYLAHRVVHGRVGCWHMPRPAHPAVRAGSLIVLSGLALDEAKLAELEWVGLGERRAEGFGRVCVKTLRDLRERMERAPMTAGTPTVPSFPGDAALLGDLRRWVGVSRLRTVLLDDGVALGARLRGVSPSLIARLRQTVRAARSFDEVEAFVQSIQNKKAGKDLERVLDGRSFEEAVLSRCRAWEEHFRHELPDDVRPTDVLPAVWSLQQHWLDAVLERWRRKAQKEAQ